MIAGARVEVAPWKRDPMDFVLWKPSDDGTPGWDSPWGRGRPGWHIECSAMARDLLGGAFDIHGGGIDLTFPHHENEIAQSRCAHPDEGFAQVWMHNEMLQVEGRKMSKSLGNFFTVRDLLEQGVPGEVIRFVLLSTHYAKPMDWTGEKAAQAQAILQRWRIQIRNVQPGRVYAPVVAALADDLNTAQAIAELHHLSAAGDVTTLARNAQLLGLLSEDLAGWEEVSQVDGVDRARLHSMQDWLRNARERAIGSGDFSVIDRYKKDLLRAGVEVRMTKDDVELLPGEKFDSAKLWSIER